MGFLSTLGRVAGTVIGGSIGGPQGAAIGGQIGGSIGGGIEGGFGGGGASGGVSGVGFAEARELELRAQGLEEDATNFARDQFQQFEDLFGDLQENLSDFFTNLDEDVIATSGLQNFEKEFQTARIKIEQDFVRRGITPESGIIADKQADIEILRAQERAKIVSEAPFKTAALQSDFLRLGLAQKPGLESNVLNTLQNQATGVRRFGDITRSSAIRTAKNQSIIDANAPPRGPTPLEEIQGTIQRGLEDVFKTKGTIAKPTRKPAPKDR